MCRNLLLAAVLATLPLVSQAQPAMVPPSLVEAWLAWQEARQSHDQPPFDWAYSYALRDSDAADLEARQARLEAELTGLAAVVTAHGDRPTGRWLAVWGQALAEYEALPARSPEPLGLPELASDLRHNPAMADITLLGTCTPPGWIEAWTRHGVERLDWQPGMTLDNVLDALPPEATGGIDTAVVIAPTGEQHERGIAAWNHQTAPLAPGARVVIQLPDRGLGGTREGDLINRELVAWLASRLPGDDCTQWEVK
ncbi:capsule biosynthesis GfcC family protein [Halomonas daqiaonensis]|uniref:Capsule biosynthesis GfcC n=1 Tax=Halomonas daqiaonensis TaxID=650850 RepID=A0A1H7GQH8_9GAMM|nr:capsule biosynthesis GfcC family protein [Halomonas daqiaonensis]SEK40413.1 Capsule biosynthesis GfcC [Halomonas daqiaonensis]